MKDKLRKIKHYTKIVSEQRYTNKQAVKGILTCPTDYKVGHTPPALSDMTPFQMGDPWGSGRDSHAWFRFTVTPNDPNTVLRIETERDGGCARNPQFIIYVN